MTVEVDCAFCTNPANKARCIVRTELVWSFPTTIPVVPGHVLVVPVRHVETFGELTDEERGALFAMAEQLNKAQRKVFGAEGFNFAWNEGSAAGQTVPHFHLHVLPRKKGDTGITEYEPRKFLYRPGSRENSPEYELKAVAELIAKQLQ